MCHAHHANFSIQSLQIQTIPSLFRLCDFCLVVIYGVRYTYAQQLFTMRIVATGEMGSHVVWPNNWSCIRTIKFALLLRVSYQNMA